MVTRVGLALGAATAAVVGALLLPLELVLPLARACALAVVVAGAALTVGRIGLVDLAVGATAAVGAYAGAVAAALAGWPAVAGLLLGALAGAVHGAVNGAVAGRVGRTGAALTSLALAGATLALLARWPAAGGVAGFHAVPLLTPMDRTDLLAAATLLVVVLLVVAKVARGRAAAAAAVATAAPAFAASVGRRPARDVAATGALAGAVVGLGGALLATLDGSVVPAGYALPLSAAILVAAWVGGGTPLGPVLGVVIVWGPALVWPTVPGLGDAPALLSGGVLALAVAAVRRGRPLRPWGAPSPTMEPAGEPPEGVGLTARGVALRSGRAVDLTVAAGEVVVIVGPNGIGKSTLLARLGGQLPARGAEVRMGDDPAPHGAVARARRGLARTWQRPPAVDRDDVRAVVLTDAAAAERLAALDDRLPSTPAGDQLRWVVARRPAVVLLDEPAAHLDPDVVAGIVAELAERGAAVVVVEHRPEIVAMADRVLDLGEER